MNKMRGHCGRFDVLDEIPEEFYPRLYSLLADLDRFAPHWCREILVSYRHDLGDAAAEISSRYDYRRAFLSLSPRFFEERDRQAKVIIHELCHITQEPLWNAVIDIRAKLSEYDPKWDEFLKETTRHAREQAVCDMTDMFYTLYAESKLCTS
jgi:hypothetical protein